jgi:hypothetical protein
LLVARRKRWDLLSEKLPTYEELLREGKNPVRKEVQNICFF